MSLNVTLRHLGSGVQALPATWEPSEQEGPS